MKKRLLLSLVGLLILSHALFAQTYNYAEALQKSIFFYECQRAGNIENWSVPNRVTWRANSAMNDTTDTGGDLTGGWYDAGDHVKFNFPMAFSATLLSWGVIEFKEGYESSGQLNQIINNLRWVAEYLLKCHTAPNELYGQVGKGTIDHGFWGSAEILKMDRPSFKIDATHPGSELAAETAAAMAAMSIVFKTVDPAFSDTLVKHAKQLYAFADTYRGLYHKSITDATAYYKSWSGYQDELVWGAIWLYKATGTNSYLTKAVDEYAGLNLEPYTTVKSYKWGLAWDDKSYGNYLLMANLKGDEDYFIDLERHLDYWTSGYNGQKIKYTPGGLAWLDQWGANRYSANTSFLALVYSKYFPNRAKKTKYYNFGVSQINYMLGENPAKRSFVCGFGNNPPLNPHHRTATGGWVNKITGEPAINRHVIYGALVGGPSATDNYTDERDNYVNNEVACDYNAGFTGALAKLAADKGGTSLSNFPQIETPTGEFLVESKVITNAKNYSLISIWFNNRTAWPSRSTLKGSIRYYIDISEGVAAGYGVNDYTITVGSTKYILQPFDVPKNIYYVEVQYNSEIYPGGNSFTRKEIQLRIAMPTTVPIGAWDSSNDFSYQGITDVLSFVDNIPMYDNGIYLAGNVPESSSNTNVIARFDFNSPSSFTAPATLNFDASKSSAPNGATMSYSWDFGDNTTGTGVTTSKIYNTIGTYNVVLTVNSGALQATKKVAINIIDQQPPKATITASIKYGSVPLVVEFSALKSSDPNNDLLTYSWNFGDGSDLVSGVNVTHSFTQAGNFYVQLTVNDGKGGTNTTSTLIIVSSGVGCDLKAIYGAPQNVALPTLSTSYNYAFTLGENGPDMSNVNRLSINWTLARNALTGFSFNYKKNTGNGYYESLSSYITDKSLNVVSPSLTFTDSTAGMANFKGKYFIVSTADYFVMVSEDNSHALYFSNTATAPTVCGSTYIKDVFLNNENSGILVSQDIANNLLHIKSIIEIEKIEICSLQGQTMKYANVNSTIFQLPISNLVSGMYIIKCKLKNLQIITTKIIKH